jgi:hypothetical protein
MDLQVEIDQMLKLLDENQKKLDGPFTEEFKAQINQKCGWLRRNIRNARLELQRRGQ